MTYSSPRGSLRMVFVETPIFTSLLVAAMPDAEYAELQQALTDRPDMGRLIVGGAGVRKIRWSAPGRSKSGGHRVIYVWRPAFDQIVLLYLFTKNQRTNLSNAQIKALSSAARALK